MLIYTAESPSTQRGKIFPLLLRGQQGKSLAAFWVFRLFLNSDGSVMQEGYHRPKRRQIKEVVRLQRMAVFVLRPLTGNVLKPPGAKQKN
jgi:hypothetical protein